MARRARLRRRTDRSRCRRRRRRRHTVPFDDADEQPTVPLDDADEQPTVPLGDASEQATVRLDNAFGRDYTPADPGSDDAHRDPDPQPYFDDTDDADLYDTEPTDLDVMAPDVLDAHHNPADSAPPADEPADPPRFNKAVAVGFIAATVVATIGVTATLLAMRSSPQPEPEQARPTTQISVAAAPAPPPPTDAGADDPDPLHRLSPRLPARIQCRPGSGRHRPHPSLGMRAQRR